jgi:hypothetical protein
MACYGGNGCDGKVLRCGAGKRHQQGFTLHMPEHGNYSQARPAHGWLVARSPPPPLSFSALELTSNAEMMGKRPQIPHGTSGQNNLESLPVIDPASRAVLGSTAKSSRPFFGDRPSKSKIALRGRKWLGCCDLGHFAHVSIISQHRFL